MRVDTQFSIFVINKPGVLASVTKALASAGVSICGLSLADSGEHGVLRIVTTDPETTRTVLSETHDRFTETDVLVVELPNQPGALAGIAAQLAEAHVNVSYCYCSGPDGQARTLAIFKVADMNRAQEALAE